MGLVCHGMLQNQLIKGSRDFRVGSPFWYVTNLPNLVSVGTLVVKI